MDAAGAGTAELAKRLSGVITAPDSGTATASRPSPRHAPPTGDPVLSYSSVDFEFGAKPVFRGLDLEVYEGECVGVTGPNGAGKSTLLDLAGAVYRPASGTIRRKYSRLVTGACQNVFYLFQSPERLFFAETVSEEITFGLRRLGIPRDSFEQRAYQALETVGLNPAEYLPRSPFSLSQGEMRRVAFAITLALQPKLLLLDEPTSCLDPAGRAVLAAMLAEYRKKGRTTIVASHETAYLVGVCDRIVWLGGGKIEAVINTSTGDLDGGATWPGRTQPLILALQEELDALGFPVVPRALTAQRLIERLGMRFTTRKS